MDFGRVFRIHFDDFLNLLLRFTLVGAAVIVFLDIFQEGSLSNLLILDYNFKNNCLVPKAF